MTPWRPATSAIRRARILKEHTVSYEAAIPSLVTTDHSPSPRPTTEAVPLHTSVVKMLGAIWLWGLLASGIIGTLLFGLIVAFGQLALGIQFELSATPAWVPYLLAAPPTLMTIIAPVMGGRDGLGATINLVRGVAQVFMGLVVLVLTALAGWWAMHSTLNVMLNMAAWVLAVLSVYAAWLWINLGRDSISRAG